MLHGLIPEASSFAGNIDWLIFLVLVLVGFWFIVAEGVFFWLIFRFRSRPGHKGQYLTGHEKHVERWIKIPHALVLICDVIIIIGAVHVWYIVKMHLPPADYTIRVTGQQWDWVFQEPGADGKLDTKDDIYTTDSLHVEVNKTYHFLLESRDVIHDFSVPVFRLKQDAVPGRTITGWFRPTETGTFDIQCAKLCGIGHGVMVGSMVVETPAQHAAWVAKNTPTSAQ